MGRRFLVWGSVSWPAWAGTAASSRPTTSSSPRQRDRPRRRIACLLIRNDRDHGRVDGAAGEPPTRGLLSAGCRPRSSTPAHPSVNPVWTIRPVLGAREGLLDR